MISPLYTKKMYNRMKRDNIYTILSRDKFSYLPNELHKMIQCAGNINTHLPECYSCNPLGLSPLMEKVES
jgi:hypothetical protein